MKTLTKVLLIAAVLTLAPSVSKAGASPVRGGGNFGLGLEFGDPGTWGAVGKFWVDEKNAFQPSVKLGGGVATLGLDYLWHTYDVIHPNSGKVPLYFGVGGNLIVQNTVAIGPRGVVGLSYIFDKENVPVDIYVQLTPTLWIANGVSAFYLYGQLGARYYF